MSLSASLFLNPGNFFKLIDSDVKDMAIKDILVEGHWEILSKLI